MKLSAKPTPRFLLAFMFIAVCFHLAAQRPMMASLAATSQSIPIIHTPVGPPDPIEPLPPGIWDDVDHGIIIEDITSPDTLFGTIPFETFQKSNGRTGCTIPLASFTSELELAHGVSLTYDNPTILGPMGYGWRLDGIPIITRLGRNYFTDGNTSGAILDDDCYSLGGSRLLFQGMDAAGGRIYRTQFGNSRAVLDASGTFTVFYPDGSRDCFAEHDSLCHYVTTRTAANGQRLAYTYLQSHGHRLPSTVSYGESRLLRMHYAGIAGSERLYRAGVAVLHNMRLTSISVERGGRVLATYQLGYQRFGGIENQLRRVTLCDSLGKSGQPLTLSYHTPGERSFGSSAKKLLTHFQPVDDDMSKVVVARGRFDYGTEDDGLLMYPNRSSYCDNSLNLILAEPLYCSGYKTSDSIIATTKINYSGSRILCSVLAAGEGFVEALAMDADGQGGDELVRINNVAENGQDVLKFQVYDTRYGVGLTAWDERRLHMPAVQSWNNVSSVRPKTFIPGDFDGDGRQELLVVSHSGACGSTATGRLDLVSLFCDSVLGTFALDSCQRRCLPNIENPDSATRWLCLNQSDRLVALDVDGGGKPSLGVLNDSGLWLHTFTINPDGSRSMTRRKADFPLTRHNLQYRELAVGDFNGDGITDLAVLQLTGTANYWLYCGDGTGKYILEDNYFYDTGSNVQSYAVADVDRDGRSDIFVQPPYSGGYRQVFLGGKWVDMTEVNIPHKSFTIGGSTFSSHATTLMSLVSGGFVTYHSYNDPTDVRRTLAQVTDSITRSHTFTHRRLYYNDDTPFPAYAHTFPFNTFAEGMLVCTGERVVAGGDTVSNTSFSYGLPVMHRQGMGFCGFEHVFATDSVTGERTLTWNEPEKFGAERERHVRNGTTDLSITLSTNAVTIDPADRHVRITETGRITHDLTTAVSDTAAFTRDSHGCLTREQHWLTGGSTRTVDYELYTTDPQTPLGSEPYVVGLETQRELTVTAAGRSVTAGRVMEYDDNCLVSRETDYFDSPDNVVLSRTYTRDTLRRVTVVSTTPYSGSALTRTITYNDTSQLPHTVLDERSLLTTLTWDDFGLTASAVTPELTEPDPGTPFPGGGMIHLGGDVSYPLGGGAVSGSTSGGGMPLPIVLEPTLTTRWHYGTLGQLDSITSPQGAVTRIIRSWSDGGGIGAVSLTETATDGQPAERLWRDAQGRIVRRSVQRFDGQWLATDSAYDHRGRLAQASRPSRTAGRHWTVFSYDNHDRLVAVTYPDGHTDSTAYNGLTTVSTVDGVATTRTFNALGQLVSVTDAGGTVEYDLLPDGRPWAVTVNGDAVTTFEYDSYGRRTAITDPSAGRRETVYDAAGNDSLVIDPRGTWVATAYNSLRQPASRTTSDGLQATCTHDLWGAPKSATDNRGHSIWCDYDSLRRLRTELVDGYRRTFSYDSVGRLAAVAHSDTTGVICTELFSYTNGTLTRVDLSDGTLVWQLISEQPDGQAQETHVGASRGFYSYDAMGRVRTIAAVRGNRNIIPTQTYTYDERTGNVATRKTFNRTEQFAYDALNRLTGNGADEYEFDDLGNVTVRGGVGELAYGSTAPYAATFLTPETGSPVPLRGQHIHYNAQQRPDTIAEGGVTATLSYRADGSRAGMTVTEADTTRSYTYRGGLTDCVTAFDAVERTKRVLWLAGTAYDATAALMLDEGDTRWRLHRVVRDHLGSIVAVADSAGYLEQRLSYDAWGALRDPTTGAVYATGASHEPMLLGRGYTGHEHLPWFGLVNMNARLYDPAVARFLSPDPEVQLPDCTQGYNRYTYCLNNPLRYADPTGEEAWYTDDRNEIQQLLDNYNRSGRSWNTNDFARYASSRKAMGGNWTYNRDASFHFSADNTRLFYSYSYGLNGTLNVVGCTAYFSRGGDDEAATFEHYSSVTGLTYRPRDLASIGVNTFATAPTTIEAIWDQAVMRETGKRPRFSNPKSWFTHNPKITDYRIVFGNDIVRFARVTKIASKGFVIADAGITICNVISDVQEKRYKSAMARGIVTIVTIGVGFVPVVGPALSIGVGLADALYGQYLYDYLEENY